MAQATEFGKAIKKRLIDIDKTQRWLIEQVHERTGLFFDDWYLCNIMNGRRKTPKIIAAICDILDLETEEKE